MTSFLIVAFFAVLSQLWSTPKKLESPYKGHKGCPIYGYSSLCLWQRETLSQSKMGTGHNQIKCCWHKQIKHSSSSGNFFFLCLLLLRFLVFVREAWKSCGLLVLYYSPKSDPAALMTKWSEAKQMKETRKEVTERSLKFMLMIYFVVIFFVSSIISFSFARFFATSSHNNRGIVFFCKRLL